MGGRGHHHDLGPVDGLRQPGGRALPLRAAKIVGAVLYRFWPGGAGFELLRPEGMVDHDVHRISWGAGSLRDAPLFPVAWVAPDDGVAADVWVAPDQRKGRQ